MVPRAGARIHFLLAKWHTFYFLIHGRHTPVGSEQQRFEPTACRHAAAHSAQAGGNLSNPAMVSAPASAPTINRRKSEISLNSLVTS